MKWKVFISVIAFCSGFFFCWALFIYGQKPTLKIVDKVEHKTEYVYIATTPQELKMCYDSKIHIDMKINDDIATVFASDKCKRTETDFKLRIGQSGNWTYYVAGAFVAGAVFVAIIK